MRRERPLILAVDDEPANIALLSKLLKHLGYDVVEASDGVAALEAVAEHQPDLVCLDVMMPRLDGIGVCQQLRSQPEHAGLPILLLTALNRTDDRVLGLEAGANDFLTKPFDEHELSARVRGRRRSMTGSRICWAVMSAKTWRARCCATHSASPLAETAGM